MAVRELVLLWFLLRVFKDDAFVFLDFLHNKVVIVGVDRVGVLIINY